MKTVLCVGLTPALQDTRVVDRLRLGDVTRCRSVTYSLAGKGVNVARILRQLGARALVTGFAGGDTGRLFLADPAGRYIRTAAPTRVCVTIREETTGRVTELVGEAALPAPREWRAFYRLFDRLARRADVVVISGALMPGAPANVYAKLCAATTGPVVIDSQREPLRAALRYRPWLAKLNAHELENTLGPTPILPGARRLLELGAQNVLITHGPRAAWLVTPSGAWRIRPPKIQAVNPIGSGDAVTAGLVTAWLRGETLPDAVRFGIACGAANALTPTAGDVDPRAARRLLRQVHCQPVPQPPDRS